MDMVEPWISRYLKSNKRMLKVNSSSELWLYLTGESVCSTPRDLNPQQHPSLFNIPFMVEDQFFYLIQFFQAVREFVVHCFTLAKKNTHLYQPTHTSTQYTTC